MTNKGNQETKIILATVHHQWLLVILTKCDRAPLEDHTNLNKQGQKEVTTSYANKRYPEYSIRHFGYLNAKNQTKQQCIDHAQLFKRK